MAVVAAKTLVITFIIFVGLVNIAPNSADYVIYSDSSQSLLPGQNLTYDMTPHRIPFGPHVLSFKDCNINLYKLGNLAWSTNTSSFNGQDCYLTLLPDGELVLRRNFHYPIWSSGVKSVPGSYAFMMGWDGGLGIVGPEIWSNSDEALAMSDPDPMITTTDYVFYNGQVTTFTYGIVVIYKNLRLVLREDCNLVLEDMNTWKILWQTNTYSTYGDCFVQMEKGGELTIKHNRRDILWRTGKRAPSSSPNNNFRLILRYDGRLVIYGPLIWSAATPIYNSPAAARSAASSS